MTRRGVLTRIITVSLTLIVVTILVFGLGRLGLFETMFSPGEFKPVDFAALERPNTPNTFLVAPDGLTPGKSDSEAPIFGLSVEKLKANWNAMIAKQPDVVKMAESPDGLQIDYVQRSELMRFPDWITVRFIPMPRDPETGDYATIAVYSRSVYGYGDRGANEKRVLAWLERL